MLHYNNIVIIVYYFSCYFRISFVTHLLLTIAAYNHRWTIFDIIYTDLKILDIDLQAKTNTTANHTSLYETQNYVVLRWGNTFIFNLKLSESFDSKVYSINVEFSRGSRPRISRETKFVTTVGEKADDDLYSWKGEFKLIDDKEVSLSVALPNNGPIGAYDMNVEIVSGRDIIHSLQADKQLVILFNPWNKS